MTDGGEGSSGHVHTNESKAKMRAGKLGKKRPSISGENHWYVKYPEKKAKFSEMLAKRNSEIRGEKHPWHGKKRPDVSLAFTGKNNCNARRVYVSELGKTFDTISDAASALGLSYSGMKYRLRKNPEKYEEVL